MAVIASAASGPAPAMGTIFSVAIVFPTSQNLRIWMGDHGKTYRQDAESGFGPEPYQTGAAKNPMARANSMKPPKAQIARFTGLAIGK